MVNRIDEVIKTDVDLTVVGLLSVLVSYCFCNKLPLSSWLKTTQIYSRTIPEVRCLKWASSCVPAFHWRPSRRIRFFGFSSW